METNSTDIYEIWSKSENIIVSTHTNPDGDAVGAALGISMAIAELGKKPLILIEKYSDKFNFIKGAEYIYNGSYDDIKPDLFIAVDCGDKKRLGDAEKIFDKAKVTFNIDHHISNTNYADNNIVEPKASSSCEVVYEILKNFCVIDKNIAEALYTGIVTDTFGFKYNSTSKKTMEIGGTLLNFGIDISAIQDMVLYEKTLVEIEALKTALNNLKIDGEIAYTTLTMEELKSCKASSKDLDGIVEHILNIKGISVSAFIYEKDGDVCKISLRSKKADVNKIASAFGGGGHILAAGAVFEGNINDALSSVLQKIKEELKNQ